MLSKPVLRLVVWRTVLLLLVVTVILRMLGLLWWIGLVWLVLILRSVVVLLLHVILLIDHLLLVVVLRMHLLLLTVLLLLKSSGRLATWVSGLALLMPAHQYNMQKTDLKPVHFIKVNSLYGTEGYSPKRIIHIVERNNPLFDECARTTGLEQNRSS